jgi:hypothetical protein
MRLDPAAIRAASGCNSTIFGAEGKLERTGAGRWRFAD